MQDRQQRKYGRVADPRAMEDFFACTLVVENRSSISEALKVVEEICDLVSRRPPEEGKTHKSPDEFCFDDLRLYVKLKASDQLPPTPLDDLIFEIQIKTFLQHAWSIATHDLVYKGQNVDWGRARVAYQIKAMLEHAEISVERVDAMAESSLLAVTDEKIRKLKAVIDWLRRTWDGEWLPKDMVRLAENIIAMCQAISVELDDIFECVRLRSFLLTKDQQSAIDQQFIATLESLIELVWDCACKRPKTSKAPNKGVSLNAQRRHGFCRFCGNLTEFSVFIETPNQMSDVEPKEPKDSSTHKRFQLSHQFCSEHRPKLESNEWNPAYRQALRSQDQFDLELSRLSKQCAKPATPQVKSGNKLVDSYYFYYVSNLTLQPADKAELRKQARLMADWKLSDRKKQILMLQWSGLNQSDIAQKLGTTRQAVSKALASIPAMFRLCQKPRSRRQPK
ncbi:hypothetical protein [Uliginosibacterium aquaticum]|uniref:hypothetical protein n=1 Tax=Uliginosibacterium aquaticum TaxID=2731212 RepID=UPI002E2E24DC|nr:hypothetical protein [Uliginosibacterium aquaticum]